MLGGSAFTILFKTLGVFCVDVNELSTLDGHNIRYYIFCCINKGYDDGGSHQNTGFRQLLGCHAQ